MALARAVLALAATAAAWAPLRRPTALRRVSASSPSLKATNADWRTRCDTEGVVSHYDFGIRLGDGSAAPAAAEAESKAAATTSFSPAYAAKETAKYVGATAVQYKLLMLALVGRGQIG